MTETPLSSGPIVAFIGLGKMGLPMVARLTGAGFRVNASDTSEAARAAGAAAGAKAFDTAAAAARGADVVITMLPDGAIVRKVLLDGGAAKALRPGGLVIDMSSSAPMQTRDLGAELAKLGLRFLDAPVSGGVKRAVDGSLSIMVGGDAAEFEAARPLFAAMGRSITHTGPLGSGHAMKALNNYVSAAGLAAACEALLVGEAFGIDPGVMVDILNTSTGRNNSTELKLKPFVLSGTFASGFSMALMTKDIRTAAELARQLGSTAEGAEQASALWTEALESLGQNADHTEIYRFLKESVERR